MKKLYDEIGETSEKYWSGLGDSEKVYGFEGRHDRGRRAWFTRIIALHKPTSVLELGCNVGTNLRCIQILDPNIKLAGIDINPEAIAYAKSVLPQAKIELGSIYDAGSIFKEKYDLVFSMGVLIHIPDIMVPKVKDQAIALSNDVILHCEEHSDRPEIVRYMDGVPYRWSHDYYALYRGYTTKVYRSIVGSSGGAHQLAIVYPHGVPQAMRTLKDRLQLWYLCVLYASVDFWSMRLLLRYRTRGLLGFFLPNKKVDYRGHASKLYEN